MKYNYEQTRNDYLTPPELVQKGLDIATGWGFGYKLVEKFGLDVCCSQKNIPAVRYFSEGQQDGLKEDWGYLNWCNPPYNECKKWIKKAYEEQQKGHKTIMLIPVRTETKYWHDYILYNRSVEIHWLRKGYQFLDPETHKPMGVFKNALALVCFR